MENYKKNLVELVSNLALEYKEYPEVIPYSPAKCTLLSPDPYEKNYATPEDMGISSSDITRLLTRLEGERCANIHSIVIASGEKIICEASRPGFSPRLPHLAHSMSKSVTAILIMLLIDDGKLDVGMLVSGFFPEIKPTHELSSLSLEHLLVMSSGASFSEGGVVSESEWTKAFLTSEPAFTPGERFAYNSMNSYILMHIAELTCEKEYGISAEDFLYDRLFAPLSIPRPLWEKSPEGILKGGFGLYLSAVSFAKLGMLLLSGGEYNGRRILSQKVINEATSPHSITGEGSGDFNYGYHIWVNKNGSDFLFNGMLGQNVWISPENSIVVAINSGNNELFSKGVALDVIRDELSHIKGGRRIHRSLKNRAELKAKINSFFHNRYWITPKERKRGLSTLFGLRKSEPFPEAFTKVLGKYILTKNNQGIFPAFVRVMQNNYQGGIKSIELSRENNRLFFTSSEDACEIKIELGFYSYKEGVINLKGEYYLVRALAEAVEDKDGSIVYKIELIFPELPNTRRITLSLSPDKKLTMGMREIPDQRIVSAFVDAIPTMTGKYGLLYTLLEKKLGAGFINQKLEELFSPTLIGFESNSEDIVARLNDEDARLDEKIESSKLVRSLIFNFLGNEEKTNETGGGALGKIVGFIGKFF